MHSPAEAILQRIDTLILRNRGEKVEVLEDTGLTLDRGLAESVGGLLEEAAQLLEATRSHYDQLAQFEETVQLDHATTLGSLPDRSVREVADLAYVSRCELLAIQEALQRSLRAEDVWKVLSHSDTGQGRNERALLAIATAIREVEGLPAAEKIPLNLEDSLVIRRQYALFRRSLERAGSPKGERLTRVLRNVSSQIHTLRNLRVYSLLRIDDRRRLMELDHRISKAIDEVGDAGEETRQVLWLDLVACSDIFMTVNNREELVEHDRHRVLEVYHELFMHEPTPAFVPIAVRDHLETLLGRDPELDRILLDPKRCEVASSRPPLERLKQQLAPNLGDRPS